MKRKITIEIRGLSVNFGEIWALKGIETTIPAGTISAIIGPNGAGKTTFLQAILGKVKYQGSIEFRDQNRDLISPQLSYVPQKMELDRGVPLTVYDFMTMSHCRHPLWIPHRKSNRSLIESWLHTVSAEHLLFKQFGKLSGGEIQRVLLALALMNEPEVILMDEPEAGIDVMGEELFRQLLHSIKTKGDITLVMVSHDLALVNSICDLVYCINQTLRCQGKSIEVLTPQNLTQLFGGELSLYSHRHLNGGKDL
jgi:zinc transport system ATP-binding protein